METQTADQTHILRQCIQKVATGPEASKDLSFDEAYTAMKSILDGTADPVQAAVFLIALRMKRETDDENSGILQAILDTTQQITANVKELVDIADPYNGFVRNIPMSPFLPTVLAACGLPTITQGLETVGPKYGVTARKILRAAGIPVDLSIADALQCIETTELGWAYIDQKHSCPKLYALVPLRDRIVKRPVLTTVEVLTGPMRARGQTHLLTGYVHKGYTSVYANLARQAGFDSAMIVRGVEGGVIPSLKQAAQVFEYHDKGQEEPRQLDPAEINIQQSARAVPLPDDLPQSAEQADHIAVTVDTEALAATAAEIGIAALGGKKGIAYDSLVYAGAIVLSHTKHYNSLSQAADAVRKLLDSGTALSHFQAAANH